MDSSPHIGLSGPPRLWRGGSFCFEVVCGGIFGAGSGCSLEPLAAGAVSGDGAGLLRGLRVVSNFWISDLVAGHGGDAAPKENARSERPVSPSGPGYRSGLHHGHRLHCRGGRRPHPGRTGGGVLDVGLRPAGHDDLLGREAAGSKVSAHRPRRPAAGRAHVLHSGRAGLLPPWPSASAWPAFPPLWRGGIWSSPPPLPPAWKPPGACPGCLQALSLPCWRAWSCWAA